MSALTERIHTNGTRGRAVPALPEHTFKDSGITIRFRKIGPATQQRLAQQIQQEVAKPEPPIVETELGKEPNPADPTYSVALKDWERRCAGELNHRLMTFAALEADVEIGDAERVQIARTRRHLEYIGVWKDDARLDQDENDRVLYILHIACASPEDLKEFGQALMQRSVPTEEAVQGHVDTFPSDVQGA